MTEATLRSRAEIATPQASRYLQQLCKHFAHKLPVTHDALAGSVAFAMGTCTLAADAATLRLDCAAPDAEQLERLQDVIARHLLRFAFREELRVAWQPA